MDIYKDVIAELKRQGHYVDFTKTPILNSDPLSFTSYRRISKYLVSEQYFSRKINKYWANLLAVPPYNKVYDVLFVIDGHGVRKILFDILKSRNRNLKTINYLFDTTSGVYQFEKNFQYFDKIFSFDMCEVKKYGLSFLPIFWTPIEPLPKRLDFFGMGGYSPIRLALFSYIDRMSKQKNLTCYLRLFTRRIENFNLYKLKFKVRQMLNYPPHISPADYQSCYIVHESLSPDLFKKYIAQSRITIDTSAPHQVGMTARYMWALGNGCKIMTTNLNAGKDGLAEDGQVYVVRDIEMLDNNASFELFLTNEYKESPEYREKRLPYRIDNWIKAIIGEKL